MRIQPCPTLLQQRNQYMAGVEQRLRSQHHLPQVGMVWPTLPRATTTRLKGAAPAYETTRPTMASHGQPWHTMLPP